MRKIQGVLGGRLGGTMPTRQASREKANQMKWLSSFWRKIFPVSLVQCRVLAS